MRIGAAKAVVGIGCLAASLAVPGVGRAVEEKAPEKGAAGRAALVGRWKLNPELSEDPREKMRQAMEQGRGGGMGGGFPGGHGGGMGRPGGGYGGGGGGWAGHGGGRGPRGDGPGAGESRPSNMGFLTASELTVTNIEPDVSIVEPEGLVRNLHPDGKKYETSSGGEVKTRWDDERLMVETKSERGQVKETWSVSSEPRRLNLELQIQRGGLASVSVKRVFDPVETDTPKP